MHSASFHNVPSAGHTLELSASADDLESVTREEFRRLRRPLER